jgi:hypothetical protein
MQVVHIAQTSRRLESHSVASWTTASQIDIEETASPLDAGKLGELSLMAGQGTLAFSVKGKKFRAEAVTPAFLPSDTSVYRTRLPVTVT